MSTGLADGPHGLLFLSFGLTQRTLQFGRLREQFKSAGENLASLIPLLQLSPYARRTKQQLWMRRRLGQLFGGLRCFWKPFGDDAGFQEAIENGDVIWDLAGRPAKF